MPTPPKRKPDSARRANRIIQQRTLLLLALLGIGTFLLLFAQLYKLQIKQHDYYQSKALDQQTRSTVVTASRGTIYDRNGNELAVSATAETVFLSPKELAEELEKPETKWTKESLSAGLSQLLGVTQESILEQMERTYSQYEVVKLRVDEDTANAVRELLNDNEVHGVYLETDAKRYYPYGSLAAHVIGFVGTDNTGLYGLEAQYEEELQGQTGLVVSAKDNGGNALPYEYEQYYASHNGDDLVLTLDTNVQYYLEKYVKEMADQFEAANGATGIVMDVKTGGVLGMVSYPNYDLNNYSEVSDARLKAAIEDGSASLADQQLRQWRNKALNDTYEPGSTFKILTLSAALEEGVVDMSSTFECSGSITVMGQTIHCSNTSGHGHQTLKEATGNSCNPAFINCGLGLGTDTFYEYMLGDYRAELAKRDIKVSRDDFNIDNFLTTLRQYYKGGRYDFLLNSKENIDLLNKRFIVFEIDAVKDNSELFPVVTIIIMEAFLNKMRRLKGVRKMLICEEAWKALSSPSMSEYLKYLYKTVRKYYGEAVVVTQEVDDIISSPIVKEAIINNSDCKILLDQKKYMNKFDGIQAMLGLTEKEKAQILSINLANHPGRKYKEVWIGLNGVQSAVYATEVSPSEYLTYTTEESEKTEVFNLAEELGGDLELAIRRLAETKYK